MNDLHLKLWPGLLKKQRESSRSLTTADRDSEYANASAKSKKWKIRGVIGFITGTGLRGLITDLGKGYLMQYGRRRLATAIVALSFYRSSPTMLIITNSTPVVNGR